MIQVTISRLDCEPETHSMLVADALVDLVSRLESSAARFDELVHEQSGARHLLVLFPWNEPPQSVTYSSDGDPRDRFELLEWVAKA